MEARETILRERYYQLKEGITIDVGTGWISPDYRAGPGKVWAGYLPERGYFGFLPRRLVNQKLKDIPLEQR